MAHWNGGTAQAKPVCNRLSGSRNEGNGAINTKKVVECSADAFLFLPAFGLLLTWSPANQVFNLNGTILVK